jgi:hypothetical protein
MRLFLQGLDIHFAKIGIIGLLLEGTSVDSHPEMSEFIAYLAGLARCAVA